MKCKHYLPLSQCSLCQNPKKGNISVDRRPPEEKARANYLQMLQKEDRGKILEEEELLKKAALPYLPAGATGKLHKYGGQCEVCDKTYPKGQIILRALVETEWTASAGTRVCIKCSPHIADETVERYGMEMGEWKYPWKASLDGEVVAA